MGGERWSTARAFLRPAMNRPNLHVIMNAHVTKVGSVLPEVCKEIVVGWVGVSSFKGRK